MMTICPRTAQSWLSIQIQGVDILLIHDMEHSDLKMHGIKALAAFRYLSAW